MKNYLASLQSKLGKQPQVATNTSIIAKFIAEETGAEIVELQTQKPYPTDNYIRLTQIAKDEQNKRSRPALKNNIDISDYDSRIAMQCFPSFTP